MSSVKPWWIAMVVEVLVWAGLVTVTRAQAPQGMKLYVFIA